jgi:hypothetical protein
MKPNQFMLKVAQVAVCSQINTEQINTVWVAYDNNNYYELRLGCFLVAVVILHVYRI